MGLKIINLKALNSISIQKEPNDRCFISSVNGIVISIPMLSFILLSLLKNGFLDEQVLEGILEEYHTQRKESI